MLCRRAALVGSTGLPIPVAHVRSMHSVSAWKGLGAWRLPPIDERRVWGTKNSPVVEKQQPVRGCRLRASELSAGITGRITTAGKIEPQSPVARADGGTGSAVGGQELEIGDSSSWGRLVLLTADPLLKAWLTLQAYCLWTNGQLDVGVGSAPDTPDRPLTAELVSPRQVPGRKECSLPPSAHIELNAIDLAWDTVVRFSHACGELGRLFFADFLDVADEESRNFRWCSQRLADLRYSYGDMPAHNLLWQDCMETSGNVTSRLALIPVMQQCERLNFFPSLKGRGEQRYLSENYIRPQRSRDSSFGRIGNSAKHNIAPEHDLVSSSDDGDAESSNGSPSFSEEAPVSPKVGSSDSSYEYLDSFLTQVDEQKRSEDVPFPVAGPDSILDTLILVCPFFLWGTAMVAMKGLLPKAGPMFVASVRLIPAGLLLVGYGVISGKKQPTGLMAWLSIALFALIDGACFQGFLVEGLKRTSAGLGSVIIDSQPLTVAVLAALLFGESLGVANYMGLALGIAGLLLLEVPLDALQSFSTSAINSSGTSLLSAASLNGLASWEGGEWRMLVAAQSMAIGTVMVRWVCQYSDPFMATGWHLVLGGIPLLALAVVQQDPALNGHIQDLSVSDWSALLYTSVGGSAISYGVFFYNATRGSLTKLSSLTFLTPMFAALFGFLCLNETLTPLQCFGGVITLGGVLLVNYKPSASIAVEDVINKP